MTQLNSEFLPYKIQNWLLQEDFYKGLRFNILNTIWKKLKSLVLKNFK